MARVGGCSLIEFVFHEDAYTGTGRAGRRWRISRAPAGWRLEFRDPGDNTFTYAATHATVFAAQTEAGRERHERQGILVESDAIEKAGG